MALPRGRIEGFSRAPAGRACPCGDEDPAWRHVGRARRTRSASRRWPGSTTSASSPPPRRARARRNGCANAHGRHVHVHGRCPRARHPRSRSHGSLTRPDVSRSAGSWPDRRVARTAAGWEPGRLEVKAGPERRAQKRAEVPESAVVGETREHGVASASTARDACARASFPASREGPRGAWSSCGCGLVSAHCGTDGRPTAYLKRGPAGETGMDAPCRRAPERRPVWARLRAAGLPAGHRRPVTGEG